MTPVVRSILFGGNRNAVSLWADAVRGNGGTVSDARFSLVNALVAALKTAGVWPLTDDILLLAAESATQALTSIKQRRLATAVNSPTFTTDRDYTFNGSTNYIDMAFIPSLHAVAMTGGDMRIATYERTNINAGYSAGLSTSSTNRNLLMRARSAGNFQAMVNSAQITVASANSQGLTTASRTAAGVFELWQNGASLGTQVPASNAALLPNGNVYVGARNNTVTPAADTFRAASIALVLVGASLSAAQELAAYTAIQAHMTAIGAQV